MGTPNLFDRARHWIAGRLGRHYAAVISIADRAALAFGGTFVVKLLGSGVGVLSNLSYLSAAASAALLAAVAIVQGAITTAITGNPTMASFVSSTMRARRDNGERVRHWVPLRSRPVTRKARS